MVVATPLTTLQISSGAEPAAQASAWQVGSTLGSAPLNPAPQCFPGGWGPRTPLATN